MGLTSYARNFVTALSIICLIGCSTTTQLTRPSTAIAKSEVGPGDSVSIQTKDGQRHEFRVTSVTDEAITGEAVSVKLANIEDMQVTRLSTAKTAGAFAGGSLAVIILLAALGAYAFGKAIEDRFND
jgi:predicted transcriptional regulator